MGLGIGLVAKVERSHQVSPPEELTPQAAALGHFDGQVDEARWSGVKVFQRSGVNEECWVTSKALFHQPARGFCIVVDLLS